MNDYLVFRLYGPLCSWGDISVGDIRPSYSYPSKSAIIGLVAAALGVKRHEQEKQKELTKLIFSVCINAPGVLIEDYHSIQAPDEASIKYDRHKDYWTRIDELEAMKWRKLQSGSNAGGGAIQSRRSYLCDAVYTVALSENIPQDIAWEKIGRSGLYDLVEDLKMPKFLPYLGRKSCTFGLPMEPQIHPAENFKDAFMKSVFDFKNEMEVLLGQEVVNMRYFSEEHIAGAQMKMTRRDQPVNKATWQFAERNEYYYYE